jgi:hypothetical protein
VLVEMAVCAARTAALLLGRHLHIDRLQVDVTGAGPTIELDDGRVFTVYRDTSCDVAWDGEEVTLLVWFHLKATSATSRWRAWLFERESILNTALYAGFPGYRRKRWMVDRTTGDYAGLYAWCGRREAQTYARYITAVLRPLSVPGSVGFAIPGDPDRDTEVTEGAPSAR